MIDELFAAAVTQGCIFLAVPVLNDGERMIAWVVAPPIEVSLPYLCNPDLAERAAYHLGMLRGTLNWAIERGCEPVPELA